MIEAIQALSGVANLIPTESVGIQEAPTGFTNVFEQQLNRVNNDLTVAESSLQKLASGEPIELHDVMIALETARIGVQTVVQIRNRLVEAYQDVMRMQI
jgi:flagellar hook-basal body complex protein FliE